MLKPEKRPTILLTNDDGIHAPGLKHLWNSLKEHCDLYICAPATEKSGFGSAVTLMEPIHVIPMKWFDETPAWKITGTPADCVRMGTNVILKRHPDLIVSGINHGSNSGRNVLFSGTVGGVIDGALRGIPGIALSSVDYDTPNFEHFEPHVISLVHYLLAHPLERGTFLNVNFPSNYKSDHLGLRFAKQGMSYYRENPREGTHPNGGSYYWMGGQLADEIEHEESDVHLLKKGYITVVPIHVEDLTAHQTFIDRKEHFSSLFNPNN
jgi:5'-nucleotidase